MIVSSDFAVRGLQSANFGYEQDSAVQQGRRAVEQMTREIRAATQSATGQYPFQIVQPQTLTYFTNADTDPIPEKVHYYIDGVNLMRSSIRATGTPYSYPEENEATTTVATFINNRTIPIFTYYDTNNFLIADPTASTSAIRMVRVFLMVNVTPHRMPADYPVQMDIQVRNLKDNL